jgi:hypothetical protein
MNDYTITIKRLVLHEKQSIRFYYLSFLGIFVIALLVLGIRVLMGKFDELGSYLSTLFLGILSYYPFHQVSKKKDHITAFETLLENLNSGIYNPTEIGEFIKTRLSKMLED